MADELGAWLEETRRWVDAELLRVSTTGGRVPEPLERALQYALLGGGKRLRPALVRLACGGLGGSDAQAARPAAAVELVHCYSLVHDDLPCMDDDALRRGRPTLHVAFDEATAVLAGDALLTLAFEVLAGGDHPGEQVRVLASAAGGAGMVGGQVLDLSLEAGASAELEQVVDMHRRKTASLFGAACEMGAVAAGADAEVREGLRAFGLALGLSFQAVDDLLDATGDARTLGKTPGKDVALERAGLVTVAGTSVARREAEAWAETAREALAGLGWNGEHPAGRRAGALLDFVLSRRA